VCEVTGGWRRLHGEKHHNSYFSPNIIRMINSRRMRWARHIVRIGKMGFFLEKLTSDGLGFFI
jgi:hypothetical protein